MARRPLLQRKKDLAYLVFFAHHLANALLIDLQPFYPAHLIPPWLSAIRTNYAVSYGDRFLLDPPPWFVAYTWVEALYHCPLSVWAVGALWRDDPKTPLRLLPFALLMSLTTFTCVVEYLAWPDFSTKQKLDISMLYGLWLFIGVFMTLDMFKRLDSTITRFNKLDAGKKTL
ncbi:hypothetical protein M501DRAFT_997272 [Patellaria atrata CBS 101060]|uniref:Efficient mitochondria targeting-associated protein 19 n=1 Tax=Patellaria atrata CBS 101060 TaxID=1346257 RepID=A0A9P4S4T0_9PEZI|nr:hypothetical protein M501DRAFT_997272 [Patellaria atrata CBS 101060]